MSTAVADAGPLIGLARAGLLPLLRDLVQHVLIPDAVSAELRLTEDRPGAKALTDALEAGWLVRADLAPAGDLHPVLDRGEAEAIALASQRAVEFLLMDERRGRAVAKRQGLRVVGTGGILLLAKRKGLLDRVKPALDRLAAGGYHLSPQLFTELLRLAGEG